VREGVFDKNKKRGVRYVDNKTKARKFELRKTQEAYNPNRMLSMSTKDALIDPHITIRHEHGLLIKDPGYYPLKQQSVHNHDRRNRVIHDYTGTPIIKVDQEGGIFDNQIGDGMNDSSAALAPRRTISSAKPIIGGPTRH